jgi:hypothetical protein
MNAIRAEGNSLAEERVAPNANRTPDAIEKVRSRNGMRLRMVVPLQSEALY